MSDLSEFLLARFAEHEQDAAEMQRNEQWSSDCNEPHNAYVELRSGRRIDSASVLADCAAKRRMVKYATSWSGELTGTESPPGAPYGVAMLRALAQVYKDHPDFNRHGWLI